MYVRPKIWWLAAVVLAVAVSTVLCLRFIPARPRAAVQTARQFVSFLQTGAWEPAYGLTTRRVEVGSSLADFRRTVARQWPGTPTTSVRLLSVWPFQSYGNRWRRWLGGREVEQSELHLEFSVGGVPFEVRERHTGHGEWKVSYFQSHAG